MVELLMRLWRNERGISSVEYAMLAVGVTLAMFVGARLIGTDVTDALSVVGGSITGGI